MPSPRLASGIQSTSRKLSILISRYEEGEALGQRALAGLEQQLGANHAHTLATVNIRVVPCVSRWQGVYGKAVALHQRALAGRQRSAVQTIRTRLVRSITLLAVHGIRSVCDGAETMTCQCSLVQYQYQGALAGWERLFIADYGSTLVQGLAILHAQQGRYDAAEAFHQRALGGQERQLRTVHSLAGLRVQQGRDIKKPRHSIIELCEAEGI